MASGQSLEEQCNINYFSNNFIKGLQDVQDIHWKDVDVPRGSLFSKNVAFILIETDPDLVESQPLSKAQKQNRTWLAREREICFLRDVQSPVFPTPSIVSFILLYVGTSESEQHSKALYDFILSKGDHAHSADLGER